MKKILMTALIAVGCASVNAQAAKGALAPTTLVDARAQIDKVVDDASLMEGIVKGLSAEDQVQFLADVNKAIADLPASVEEKTAKFLNVNHLAVKSAKKGNTQALLGEVFATVPPESLTLLNERFAIDLLNRSSDPKVTYTDDQWFEISSNVVQSVADRVEGTDNPSTRTAFAILTMVRASNGSPEDLTDRLVGLIKNEEAREMAKDEWIPSALGKDGRELGYEPILASADAGKRPDFQMVLVIAGHQFLDTVLGDLRGKNTEPNNFIRTRSPILDAVIAPLKYQVPMLGGDVFDAHIGVPHDGNPEPTLYPWQS